MLTAKGNISYSAETVGRYKGLDLDYGEKHIALPDCYLEMGLAKYMYNRYYKTLKLFVGTSKKSLVKPIHWTTIRDEVFSKDKIALKIEWLQNILGLDNDLVAELKEEQQV